MIQTMTRVTGPRCAYVLNLSPGPRTEATTSAGSSTDGVRTEASDRATAILSVNAFPTNDEVMSVDLFNPGYAAAAGSDTAAAPKLNVIPSQYISARTWRTASRALSTFIGVSLKIPRPLKDK